MHISIYTILSNLLISSICMFILCIFLKFYEEKNYFSIKILLWRIL